MKIYYRICAAVWCTAWTVWGVAKIGQESEASVFTWHGVAALFFLVAISFLLGALSYREHREDAA